MVSMALPWARGPRKPATRRAPRRGDILAWSVAAAALICTGASVTLGSNPGAMALVMPGGHLVEETQAHREKPEPAAALLDPTKFRRAAPPDDGRPRVAVILRGLGLSRTLTNSAIQLPADVTLGLSAYARDAQKLADAARAAGHEVFLDIPVEPNGFPTNDPGPQALLSTLASTENARRLDWSLARFSGYPGIVLSDASPVLNSKETMAPLFRSPALHGLVWAHGDRKGFADAPIATAEIEVVIHADQEPRALGDALSRLEAMARQDGAALALVEPSPIMIAQLAAWAAELDRKGIVLVPASALAGEAPEPVAEAGPEPAHEAPAGHDEHAPAAHGDTDSHETDDAHATLMPVSHIGGGEHAEPAPTADPEPPAAAEDHGAEHHAAPAHPSETPAAEVSGGHDAHH